ncbi:MAG: dienelactone hydrolase family protein [Chloroflexi bacterium]|nr:dienelactone hydrolase family protein [Chloroflexota bacterium]
MKDRSLISIVIALLVAVAVALSACRPGATPSPAPSPTVTRTPAPAQPAATPSPVTAKPATPKPTTPAPTAKPTTPAPTKPAATKPAPTPAQAPPGAVTQANFTAGDVSFSGAAGNIKAYEVRPNGAGPFPALIVIHENRGVTEHIKDVSRRFANQGYLTLAVDLLSRVGGREKFTTDDDAVNAINGLSRDGVQQDLQSAFDYLKGRNYVKADRIGVIGYCWGGGNSLLMATRVPGLRASVVYYGPNPPNIDDVARIGGAVLGIYGAEDTRISMNVPALAEAMKKHNKSFEHKIFPGAAHAFFNDTGARYHPQAAAEAWPMTLDFLARNLKGLEYN